MQVDALVLGGGISGLSAAFRLQQRGFRTFVIEKQRTVGGRTQSISLGDVGVDSGALFLTDSYKQTLELIRELGIQQQIVPIVTKNGIVARDRIFTLPPHSLLDIAKLLPTRSLLKLPRMMGKVLRDGSKLNMGALLKSCPLDSESVADFARRHGDAALLNLVFDPILQGIWYWDPATTTQVALYFLLKQALTMRLYTLACGMGGFSNLLAQKVHVDLGAEAIQSRYDPATNLWKTVVRDLEERRTIESRTVLCTLPATVVDGVFVELPERVRAFFTGVRYTSIIAVHLLLDQMTRIPSYYGLYYPAAGARTLAAVAIQSNTVRFRTPPGCSVVSIYASPAWSRELREKPDEEIVAVIISELGSTYPFFTQDLAGSVLSSRIIRIEPALPVFHVGYIDRLRFFQESLVGELPPGLFFAGDYLGGPHMEGAIISARAAVANIQRFLQEQEGRDVGRS